jgi:hypothetical protein
MGRTMTALLLLAAACGGQTVQKPVAGPGGAKAEPAAAGAATAATSGGSAEAAARGAAGGDPWALPPAPAPEAPPREPGDLPLDGWQKAAKVKGVAPAPAACAAFARRAPAKTKPESVSAALAERDPARRDAMLAALEAAGDSAAELPAGALRALRADLAPIECGDAIVDPYLNAKANAKASANAARAVTGLAGHALVGLSLAAKLARTAHAPPTMSAGTRDKAKVKAFVQGPLEAWMVEQATAIERLSAAGSGLSGYGRAVAAVEAGTADLRLVDDVRSAPLPNVWDA